MLALAAKLLEPLVGKYVTTLTLPAMIAGLVFMGYQLMGAHDARIKAESANVCNIEWEKEVRRQERDAASADAKAARALLEEERHVNEGMRHELEKIRAETAALQQSAAAETSGGDGDARCLSDSVLRSLGGDEPRAAKRGAKVGASRSSKAAP